MNGTILLKPGSEIVNVTPGVHVLVILRQPVKIRDTHVHSGV
jgi:hypothetical protein